MDGAFDIPDSTDWIDTPLKDFSTLENALHCQICKEFYDTPMLTSCSHTFCSKCIRTSLSTDGKCPACRTADQASKLRNNWAIQEVVSAFLVARPAALDVARKANDPSKKPGKRKRILLDSEDVAEQDERDRRTTRSKSRKLAASQTSEAEIVAIEDSDADGDFEPEKAADDGLVECPLGCGKRMKIEAVEPHLDRCEDEKKLPNRAKSKTPVNAFGSSRPTSTQTSRPQERISELSYSLLTETKLRRKLEDLGLPSSGPKALLIKRHTEWVNIWNANCDSNQPRTKRELLHELDVWERTQGGKAPGMSNLASNVMRKDFDGAGWARKNQDDFSKLIADAKRKKNNPSLEDDPSKIIDTDGREHDSDIQNHLDAPAVEVLRNCHAYSATKADNDIGNGDPSAERSGFFKTYASTELRSDDADFQHDSIATNGAYATGSTHLDTAFDPVQGADHPGLFDQSLSQRNSFSEGNVKKVPMFAVPQEHVTDIDGGKSS